MGFEHDRNSLVEYLTGVQLEYCLNFVPAHDRMRGMIHYEQIIGLAPVYYYYQAFFIFVSFLGWDGHTVKIMFNGGQSLLDSSPLVRRALQWPFIKRV